MTQADSRREEYESRVEEIRNSDMSFNERRKAIQRVQDNLYASGFEKMKDDVRNYDSSHKAIVIGGLFLIGGILGVILVPNDPASGFLIVGIIGAGLGFVFGTETGLTILENAGDVQQQQQQKSASSKPKRICKNCGWQNPTDNNFCHDCGTALNRP